MEDIKKIFSEIFTNIKISSNQMYVNCIYCGLSKNNKPHLSIDLSDKIFKYHCFRCNTSGSIYKLYRTLTSEFDSIYSNLLSFKYLNNKDYYDEIIRNYIKTISSDKNRIDDYSNININKSLIYLKPKDLYDTIFNNIVYRVKTNRNLYTKILNYVELKFGLSINDINNLIKFIKFFRINPYLYKNNLVIEYYYYLGLYKQRHVIKNNKSDKYKIKNYSSDANYINLNIYDYYLKVIKNNKISNDNLTANIFIFEGITDLISFYLINLKEDVGLFNSDFNILISIDGKSNLNNICNIIDYIFYDYYLIGYNISRYNVKSIYFLYDNDVNLDNIVRKISSDNFILNFPVSKLFFIKIKDNNSKDVNDILNKILDKKL